MQDLTTTTLPKYLFNKEKGRGVKMSNLISIIIIKTIFIPILKVLHKKHLNHSKKMK